MGTHFLRYNMEPAMKRHIGTPSGGSVRKYDILDLEIEQGCNGICHSMKHANIQLFKYQEVPIFLKGNPYVVNGYRCMLPFSLCCKR